MPGAGVGGQEWKRDVEELHPPGTVLVQCLSAAYILIHNKSVEPTNSRIKKVPDLVANHAFIHLKLEV